MTAGETVEFAFDTETKNAIRYKEIHEDPRHRDLMRYVYLDKWFIGDVEAAPERIKIVVFTNS